MDDNTRMDDNIYIDNPLVVYYTGIDNYKYSLIIKRTDTNTTYGYFELYHGDKLVHREQTTFMYGAIFGPDIDDITNWSLHALDLVDNPEKRSILNEGTAEL